MRNKFTKQAQTALTLAKAAAIDFELGYIGTEHLLLGLLSETEGTAGRVLEEFQVDGKKLVELIDKLVTPAEVGNITEIEMKPPYSPRTEKVLKSAVAEAQNSGCEKAGTEHLLLAMLRETDCVGTRLLYTMGVNIQKLYAAVLGAMGYDNESIQEEFQAAKAMQNPGGSPTPALDQYSRDLTQMAAEGKLDPVVGREKEISRLIQILSRRTKNNPCLVGEPGVGKTAIAEGLAQRILAGSVPETIKDKRLVVLDLSGMVAGSKYRGEFEERIRKVVDEVHENQGILLFIDELHTIIGAGGAEGALDASNILKPSLSRGELQIIGATTLEEYRKYIEKDAALERRFQPVTVEEPSEEEAYEILKGLRPYYERHHKVEISDEALEAAVKMSVRYINDRFLPDKAIDLIDEAASKVQLSGYQASSEIEDLSREIQEILQEKERAIKTGYLSLAKECQEKQKEAEARLEQLQVKEEKKNQRKSGKVDEKAVASIVSDWTKIPVQRLTEGETRRLAQLEKELHKRVIGQEEAVHAVSQAVKRGRVGLKDPNRPIGSFLFLGPTGVGKTELSKALAQAVFGSEQAMIRVDMSEYMEKHSVSKLIGSPPGYVGYDEGGQLSEKVRRNPYSVILFDEIEKAHPDVFNILLQVLDDGHITDAHGRKVDFKQTIIIMTSNAGAQAIVEPKQLGFISQKDEKKDYEKMKSGVMEEVRRLFKPEFLNRIDEIMVFHTLNKEEIRKIVLLLLKSLEKRCEEQMDIHLNVTNSAVDYIAEAGFDAKYGARPLRRVIQSKIEDRLANELLEGKIKRGDIVQVQYRNKEIRFIVK
ncbi:MULTISPECIES: ATP-dependent Clp protease ATP-binding subunit [unclassified Ruminococcus]|uniref:ATP-dependent Clp protease ATP-binding subunit n=1 Tax=unclassified Ruminococcus TaxID=2608920 RepID=UPI00189E14A1|nr:MULTISPECIES: ATP-dependent Clp protease ATP-binding subunit [unclassified Ruminococcus]MDB8772848.1 ATP-dependent Clp protease ATP-binding subunit [Ruminococcus sp. 1001136sp1]MDB8783975.1 ATP-dependent Clp protease ATP-binding subunit [Ruminococcus sp. 1001136sp1]